MVCREQMIYASDQHQLRKTSRGGAYKGNAEEPVMEIGKDQAPLESRKPRKV